MSRVTLQQLLLAGSHFGHLTRRWHPKMKPYILMERNRIHLIDLRKTQECIERACAALAEIAAKGEQVLFVGTKPQARDVVVAESRRIGVPHVSERWLGGTLTNFQTVRQGIKTLNSLEKMMTDGTFEKLSKKERLMIERRRAKLLESIGGIREMAHIPGAMFVIDLRRERIAVAEARRLNIPIFAIVDTNVDPDLVDYPIPANDDAFKSIALITRAVADAAGEGIARHRATAAQVHEAAPDTAGRDAEHRQGRTREDQAAARRRRVRRPGGPGGPGGGHPEAAHHGEEKPPIHEAAPAPQPPDAPPAE